MDGVLSRDELEEASTLHKSFDKSYKVGSNGNITTAVTNNNFDTSRISINDYPSLLNNRTLSFGGTVQNSRRMQSQQ